jgi:hypothetical protein
MPDPLFNDLYDDTRGLTWQATDQVRARGAQRTRRQRLAAVTAAAAAMLVVAGGAVALAGPQAARPVQPVPADSTYRPAPVTSSPSPSVTSSPSATPSRGTANTESTTGTRPPTAKSRPLPQGPVPNAAMLQIEDVARGEMGVYDHHGVKEGYDDWVMPIKPLDCDRDENAPEWPTLDEHQRSLVHEEDPDGLVVEQVYRFATAAQAQQHLDDLQTMVRACMRVGDGVFLSIVVRDFAGPGSMVVRSMADSEAKTLHIWVRRGNLLAVVWKKKMPTDQEAVRLGERAAARLCAGTVC